MDLDNDAGMPSSAKSLFQRLRENAPRMLNVLNANRSAILILSRSAFDPRQFSKPANSSEAFARLQANSLRYKAIYGLTFAAFLIYTILSSPWLLMGLLLLASAWAYAFVLKHPDDVMEIAGFPLRRREKLIALVPFTVLVIAVTGMVNSLAYVACCSSLLLVPHASFHECAPLDALDELELQGLAELDIAAV